MDIVLLEQSDVVSIYSIRKDGETLTEFENFLLKHQDDYSKDLARIIYRLDRIKETGCFDRHFRYAGKYKDRTFELPSKLDTIDLRVYCIVLSENIIILGNGGIKTTDTYNEDPWLDSCETEMQQVDAAIKRKEKRGEIRLEDKILVGDLSFEL